MGPFASLSLAGLFFWLIAGHVLGDFALQSAFLAQAKNHKTPVPGVPWPLILSAHAYIHATFVMLITGSLLLALLEFICHVVIDYHKSAHRYGFATDQALHIACKVLWLALAPTGLGLLI